MAHAIVKIDSEESKRQIALRGLTLRAFSVESGLDKGALQRALGRGWTTQRTLDRMAETLARLPVRPGAELLLAAGREAVA